MKNSRDFVYECKETFFKRYILRYVKNTKDSKEVTPIHIKYEVWNQSFTSQFIVGIVYDEELNDWYFIQKREDGNEVRYWVLSYDLNIMQDVARYFEDRDKM